METSSARARAAGEMARTLQERGKNARAVGEASKKDSKAEQMARATKIAEGVLGKRMPTDARSVATAVEEGRAAAQFIKELEAARAKVAESGQDVSTGATAHEQVSLPPEHATEDTSNKAASTTEANPAANLTGDEIKNIVDTKIVEEESPIAGLDSRKIEDMVGNIEGSPVAGLPEHEIDEIVETLGESPADAKKGKIIKMFKGVGKKLADAFGRFEKK